jgi:DNA-binding transcriptional LysR family regulator
MTGTSFPDFKLVSFLQVIRSGGINAAARALNLTQPAVSQHIDSLEELYGVKLFKPSGRGVVPTAEGLKLFQYATEIEALYLRARRNLESRSGPSLRLGATLTIAEYALPHYLPSLEREYGEGRIFYSIKNTEDLLIMLFNGDIDVALVEGPFPQDRTRSSVFAADALIAVRAPCFRPERFKHPLSASALLELPLVLRESGSGTRAVFESWLERGGISLSLLKPTLEIAGIGAIRELVAKGLGISILSSLAVEQDIDSGRLVKIRVEGMPIRRSFCLVAPPEMGEGEFNRVMRCLSIPRSAGSPDGLHGL